MGFEKINSAPGVSSFDREQFRKLHNQKTGDFNPETGVIYPVNSADYEKAIAYQEKSESIEKLGSASEAEQRVTDLIGKLNSIALADDVINDESQRKLLDTKLAVMKNLIGQSLEYAVDYVDSIRKMSKIKLGQKEMEREDYLNDLQESDAERRAKHNALIDSLKIANRFLQNNFGQITSERMNRFEADERRAGRQVVKVERLDFGKNGLVSDKLNLEDRNQVKDWAIVIVDSLEKIKKELI